MSEIQIGVLFIAVGIPVVIYLVSLINYRITRSHVRCYWGPIPIRKVAIDDIRDAERGHRHMSESWTNTIWVPTIRKKSVTLFRRTGGFKRVIITPDDPDGFIDDIKSHPRFRSETITRCKRVI
jgi:hypothetical protein